VNSLQLLAHYRHLAQQKLTIFDLETTGCWPPQSRVIEISVLHASIADGIYEQSTHLVNPGVEVPSQIVRFTGISQAMVDQAEAAETIWPRYAARLAEGVLTAHNLSFDYGFSQAECHRFGLVLDRPKTSQLCTVHLSRLMLADLPSRSLPKLVQHFHFPVNESHRAEADTLACWYLAQRLLTQILEENEHRMIQRFQEEWLPLSACAHILGRSRQETHELILEDGFEPRTSPSSGTFRYRRGWAEELVEKIGPELPLFS
jgi:DNA polymerase III subunit epsilon